jgi:hypothetical protein
VQFIAAIRETDFWFKSLFASFAGFQAEQYVHNFFPGLRGVIVAAALLVMLSSVRESVKGWKVLRHLSGMVSVPPTW